MLRWVKHTILFSILVLLMGIALLFLFRVPIVEFYLSRSIGSKVTVTTFSIDWNKITFHSLKIQNPKEAKVAYAFETSKVTIKAPLAAYLKNPLKISRLKIEDPTIRIELQMGQKSLHNWENLKVTPEEIKTPSKREVEIDNLSLINTNIELLKGQKTKLIAFPTIPYLEFNNVMFNGEHISKQILRLIIDQAIEQLKDKNGLEAFLNSLFSNANLPEPSILENLNEKVKDGLEKIKKKTTQVQDYLEKLFSK